MARKPEVHPEEVELLQRLRSGDQRARTAVVRRYHTALMHHAFCILRDESLAEDAVQDGWLAAFKCIDRFKGRSSLFTWLVRIVVNKAKNRRRRERRSIPLSTLVAPSFPGGLDGATPKSQEMPLEELTPEWLLLEREAVRTLDTALRALPDGQRSVVVLRDLEGASPAEACQLLEISDLTQRVRLSRARATLHMALREDRRAVA